MSNKFMRPYNKFTDKINKRYQNNKSLAEKSIKRSGLKNVILSQQSKIRNEIEDRIFKIPDINVEKDN
jgi:hypothetical protein